MLDRSDMLTASVLIELSLSRTFCLKFGRTFVETLCAGWARVAIRLAKFATAEHLTSTHSFESSAPDQELIAKISRT